MIGKLCEEGEILYTRYFVASCVDDVLTAEIRNTWKEFKKHTETCEQCSKAMERGQI